MTSRLQFCTFASREYLPFARNLAASLARHDPGHELVVLLVDDLDGVVDATGEPFRALRNEDLLDEDELHRMYLYHGHMFLAAIKPFLIDHVVRESGSPTLFLDTDVAVYGSLADLAEPIEQRGVLLFPHALGPYPNDGLMPDDTTILSAGTFNDGMIGYGERGLRLLEFLMGRLRRECLAEPSLMRVCGQRWLDYAPSFYDVAVCRDPGLNAAYWNLHERPLSERGDVVYAGDAPLRAYHFSGYDPTNPGVLSKHCPERPRIALGTEPLLARLAQEFVASLRAEGYDAHRGIPLPFDTLPGGIPADNLLRACYRDAVLRAEAGAGAMPPDGYDPAQRGAFVAWAAAAFAARGLQPPPWAAPSASAPSPGPGSDDLVRALARSTGEALENLNRRLAALEGAVGELLGAGAAASNA